MTTDTSSAMNYSDFYANGFKDQIFNKQDREILPVLEKLMDIDDPLHSQNKNINVKGSVEYLVTFVQTLCLT